MIGIQSNWNPQTLPDEMQNDALENSLVVSHKVKYLSTYDLAVHPYMITREKSKPIFTLKPTQVFITILFAITKKMKTNKCLSMVE